MNPFKKKKKNKFENVTEVEQDLVLDIISYIKNPASNLFKFDDSHQYKEMKYGDGELFVMAKFSSIENKVLYIKKTNTKKLYIEKYFPSEVMDMLYEEFEGRYTEIYHNEVNSLNDLLKEFLNENK